VERLEQARAWLAAQPEVDARRIVLHGVSKGAEFALVAATKMPWIAGVVAVVPSDVVWEGWGSGVAPGRRSSFAWRGQPLEFVPYVDFEAEFRGFGTGEPVLVRRPHDKGRAAHPDRVAAARIPVERFAGPVLLIGGHADQVWDSGAMAERIAAARRAAGLETVALVYRDAGHAIAGTGWSPTTQSNASPMKMGGTPAADARAQAEAFQQTLAFLRRTLTPQP
jgi:dienelactone hydrolase